MQHGLRVTPGKSLFLFVCWWVLSTILGSVIISFIGVDTIGRLRFAVVTQDIFLFILPACFTMLLAAVRPWQLIGLSVPVKPSALLLIAVAAVVSIPAMNNLVAWNESLSLPDSWSGLEQILRNSEQSARDTVSRIMGGTSVTDLLLAILIMGCLTGLAEEMFFRGALQPLLAAAMRNRHAAVWATAFIFSAVHLQFFGFFPRLLMGAFFGYLVVWTGSLRAAVFAHALNNSLVVLNFWLMNRGLISFDADSLATGSGAPDIAAAIVSAVATAATVILIRRTARKHTPKIE